MQSLSESFSKMSAKSKGGSSMTDHAYRQHLNLLYPDNVLTVLDVPPLPEVAAGKFPKISDALRHVHERATAGKARKFSIIVSDGDYVDDLILPWGQSPPRGLAVEICGVGSTKVTYSQPGKFLCVWGKQKLTLRNLNIMDHRRLRHSDTDDCLIEVTNDAVLHLTKVTIDSDFAYAQDKKAAISSGHQYPELGKALTFVISIRSEVVFTECVVNSGYIGCQLNSSVSASGSKFNKGFFRATNNSTLDISRCEIVGNENFNEPESPPEVLIQGQCGVSVTLKDSIIEKWHIVAGLRQRDTKVHVENCFLECNIVCLLVFNADATFVKNQICCNLLLHMEMNTEGKVEFRRNKMITSEPARFELDKHSKRPVHDFKKVEYYEDQYLQTDRPKAKEKSERAKQLNAAAAKGDYIDLRGKFSTPGDDLEKKCEKCDVSEVVWIRTMKQANRPGWEDVVEAMVGAEAMESGRLKFKHCSACKSVCYCSRECQKADWKDHKHICATYRAARKGDGK